jgi:RNA polymerase sigma factor (sigma-70 family)
VAVAKMAGVADGAGARVAAVAARHERTLLRVARQASLCHDDALDAYQRALEIFVRRVDTVDPATELSWLKVVVRHEALAIRRGRSESVAGEELDLDSFVPGTERSVEDKLTADERVRRSAEALRALKPDEAKALLLKAHGLSYEEIGARCGWSYTKVNRSITEGRRRFLSVFAEIESGAECERFAPIVEALGNRSASAAQVLQIRPHLRHCTACRAAVRDLHLTRLRRASLFWPVFAIAEPLGRLPTLKHDAAALFHRAQASDFATGAGVAGSGGGGRIATVGAVLGLCLGGASVGTVCVVTDRVPILGSDPPARHAARAEQPKPKVPKRSAEPPPESALPVATVAPRPEPRTTSPEPKPSPRPAKPKPPQAKPSASASSKRESAEAAPTEFGFEQQAPAPEPAATSTQAVEVQQPPPQPTQSEPPPSGGTQTGSSSQKFSPAEQEFAP